MAKLKDETFKPDLNNHKTYSILFKEYEKLYNYFGKGENNVMKIIKQMRVLK